MTYIDIDEAQEGKKRKRSSNAEKKLAMREELMMAVPEEFRCPVSNSGMHYFSIFQISDTKNCFAVCQRCLKRYELPP